MVPNAAILKAIPFADCTEEVINQQFSVNFMEAAQTVRAFLPYMNEGGAILFITSFATQVGFPGLSVHIASKASVKSLVQCLAVELAPQKSASIPLRRAPRTHPCCLAQGSRQSNCRHSQVKSLPD